MKKEDLIAKGLSEEQAKAVLEIYDEKIKDYVPKIELDNANSEIASLKDTVKERDKQLKQIKENAGDNEDLKKQIEKLEADNKTAAENYKAEIKQLKINAAVDMALTKSGAKTMKAVKALLDMNNIKIDGEGNVTGVDEQVKSLAESEDTKYLFNTEPFKGANIGNSDNVPAGGKKIEDMTYTEMEAYFAANPGAKI